MSCDRSFASLIGLLLCVACSGESTSSDRGPAQQGGPVSTVDRSAAAGTTSTQPAFNVDNPEQLADAPPEEWMARAPEDRCTETDIFVSRITPTVMLLVDGSRSMEDPYGDPPAPDPDADGGVDNGLPPLSRWLSVRSALVGTGGVVPALQDLVKFGLAVYGTTFECPLPLPVVAPALNNVAAITAGLPAFPPGTYTPTGIALEQIVGMLPDPGSAGPDVTIEPQIIVLATDGDPNDCSTTTPSFESSIAAAQAARAKNQKMYVISVGMDAAAAHLQEMANIGAGLDRAANPGATVYYPENRDGLAATLAELVGAELSCEVELQGLGVRVGRECVGSTVALNGQPLTCDPMGEESGWVLVDSFHIELKGEACDTFKSSASAALTARFPCESLVE